MSDSIPDVCSRCGGPWLPESPAGLCPRCLLSNALDSAADVTYSFVAEEPGKVLETLAHSVGPMPRVLLPDTGGNLIESPVVKPSSEEMPPKAERSSRVQLLGEIGRGGMGAILKGRDPDLGRDLAVKVLLDAHRDKPELIRRFVEEAQIGGQLQHPGVVPVYELGTFGDSRPYFTMKLVKGRTLADLLASRKTPSDDLPQLLRIFEQIAQTVAYAHSRGVIHRDLKPSNVMVGSFGEVQVMDWGLAKVLPKGGVSDDAQAGKAEVQETVIATNRSGSDVDDLSRTGSVMGTPSYMAPEQARGEIDQVNERADVFALGSILCEILTGQPAFTGRSSAEIQRKAARGDVLSALALLGLARIDAELRSLTIACLSPETDDRPRHAGEVAERINAYRAGVEERLRQSEILGAEEKARAEEAIKRVGVERQARRLQVGLTAAVLALTTMGGLGAIYDQRQRSARAATVAKVIGEASTLRSVASANPEDIGRWQSALAAVRQAESVAVGDPEALRQLAVLSVEVKAGAEAAERDKILLDKVVDIRSAKADDLDGSETDAAYAEAFREAGLDLLALTPADAGAKIKAHPPSVALALAAGVDDWAAVRLLRKDRAGAARLSEAARVGDPDPWHNDLRAALALRERGQVKVALKDLADKAKSDELGAVGLALLGRVLFDYGELATSEAVLRRAQRLHPGDVWANYDLARLLEELNHRDDAIRFYTAARALRPETAHELAHALADRGEVDEAIEIFRELARLRPTNGRHLACLGDALQERGRSKEAAEVFERAVASYREEIRIKPDDTSAHSGLGRTLKSQGKLDEAVLELREAIRLQPEYAEALGNLGNALDAQGKRDEAVAAYREAIRIKPEFAGFHQNLAITLKAQGKLGEAVAEYREAIRIKPDFAAAHNNLGLALDAQGKHDEAVAAYREAIRLKPDNVATYNNLGLALNAQGKIDEAVAAYREAIRIKPEYAAAHNNLGLALYDKREHDKAVDAFREAIRVQPGFAEAYSNLGNALNAQGKLDEAVTAHREVIRIKPDFAAAHSNLGAALGAQGHVDEAVAEFREAIRLKPDQAEARFNLAQDLRRQGNYAESLAMFRTAHELGSRQPGWRYPSAQWVAQAERLAALAERLPALLKGEDRPRDVPERLAVAQMCYDTKRYAAAARFWAEALQADSKLGDNRQLQVRYNAACAAILASTGPSKDNPPPSDATKIELRDQALDWLKAELVTWAKVLDAGPAQLKAGIAPTLQHWKTDADLASIRDPEPLSKLADDQQKAWRSFWEDVDQLHKKANNPRP